MKKLIEVKQEHLVVCDNPKCDYNVPFQNNNHRLINYLNKPCPLCGENLLTESDYIDSLRIDKAISWINKWFSWITIFSFKNKPHKASIKAHRGIKIVHHK